MFAIKFIVGYFVKKWSGHWQGIKNLHM